MVVKSDAVVLRQHHPVSRADVSKPYLVFRILGKMIVVNLYPRSGSAQRLSDGFFAKRAINEENNLVKRL